MRDGLNLRKILDTSVQCCLWGRGGVAHVWLKKNTTQINATLRQNVCPWLYIWRNLTFLLFTTGGSFDLVALDCSYNIKICHFISSKNFHSCIRRIISSFFFACRIFHPPLTLWVFMKSTCAITLVEAPFTSKEPLTRATETVLATWPYPTITVGWLDTPLTRYSYWLALY